MPNALAYLALFAFIPLGIGVFFMLRPPIATLVVMFGAVMFLPEATELDLPALPPLGKLQAATISCLLGAALRARRRLRDARIFRGPDRWVVVMMLGALGTSLTNTDVLVFGPTVLPALTVYEAFSVSFTDFMTILLPFFFGRAMFTNTKDLKALLSAIALAGVLYTPFMFIELMLSPQLHNWIYGFHQHQFVQAMRGGGYRPMVFMTHGLAVAMLLTWGVLAGLTLLRAKKSVAGLPTMLVTPYIAGFLAAAKSLGAFAYAALLGPLVGLLRPRTIVRVAVVLSVAVFAYPILRAVDVFPDRALVGLAYSASGDRAQSLDYRFTMESMLAERASERPVFGWGRFRRNMVFNPETGGEVSVSDGHWIIVYGIRGAVGFICFFAYLLGPVFTLRMRLGRVAARDEQFMLAGLALIIALSAVDLLPNGLFNFLPLFFAGALHGCTRALSMRPPTTAPDAIPVVRRVE